jgi:hypothetical protein
MYTKSPPACRAYCLPAMHRETTTYGEVPSTKPKLSSVTVCYCILLPIGTDHTLYIYILLLCLLLGRRSIHQSIHSFYEPFLHSYTSWLHLSLNKSFVRVKSDGFRDCRVLDSQYKAKCDVCWQKIKQGAICVFEYIACFAQVISSASNSVEEVDAWLLKLWRCLFVCLFDSIRLFTVTVWAVHIVAFLMFLLNLARPQFSSRSTPQYISILWLKDSISLLLP